MKKWIIASIMMVMAASPSLANITAIDLCQNASGKYELRLPTILDMRETIKIIPNANIAFTPIFTSANDNVTNMGFQSSKYDLTLGTALPLWNGIFSLDAGLAYRPANNRECYLETIQATVASRWYFVW